MDAKNYKICSVAVRNAQNRLVEFPLEFDGDRAFVIWDTVLLQRFRLKVRLEIDPGLLQEDYSNAGQFVYAGKVILPQPENN